MQEKKFLTPSMLKAEEEWQKKSPEEKEATKNAFEEKLRKYYSSRPPREVIIASMETEQED